MKQNGKEYFSECCNQIAIHEEPYTCYGCGKKTGRWWHHDDIMSMEEYKIERSRLDGLYNNDNKFDVDLAFAQINEKAFVDLLEEIGFKAEIKTERDEGKDTQWVSTENIAVEFASRGKKSGILVTEAEWWVTMLNKNDEIRAIVMIPTNIFKKRIKKLKEDGHIRTTKGGDDKTSDLMLVPINKLLLEENG